MGKMKFEEAKYGTKRWFDLKDLLNEQWEDIENYNGIYQISNYGRLKSFKQWVGNRYYDRQRILHFDTSNGYYCIKLSKQKITKWKYIHRLVAETFMSFHQKDKNVIDHLDANKLNNRIDNLEWVTTKENNKRARDMGLTIITEKTREKMRISAIKNNNAKNFIPYRESHKRKINQYDLEGNFIATYESIKCAKKIYGNIHIIGCCQHKRNMAGGYIWRYANEDKS